MSPKRLLPILAVAAMLLSSNSALAAGGGGGGGGALFPTARIVANTSAITLSGYPAGAVPITVTRDGVVIGTPIANVDGTGQANLNVPGIVAPDPLDCWTAFTPQILAGDVVNIGLDSVVVPDLNVGPPTASGDDVVVHGSAADATGTPLTNITVDLVSRLIRFSTGAQGHQRLGGALAFDAPGGAAFTGRFAGLTPSDREIALGSAVAEVSAVPQQDALPGSLTAVVAADAAAQPGPAAGCNAPWSGNGVTSVEPSLINVANSNDPVTVTGTATPDVRAVSVGVGSTAVPATLSNGSWTATLNPANLPEGTSTVAGSYTNGSGSTHGVTATLVKDTVAPATPTSDVDPGAYGDVQSVSLAAEPGSTIHYTTDGTTPSADNATFDSALTVDTATTIKAVAIDDAGNASPVASFAYTITFATPQTTFRSGPQGTTSSTAASFAFTSSVANSSFSCQLDAGDWAPCSSPATFTVGAGDHTFAVRATGPHGQIEDVPVTRAWTVDPATTSQTSAGTAPPNGTVTSAPEATGATEALPVVVGITTPSGGDISVTTAASPTTPSPTGWAIFGRELTITAPPESSTQPLRLVFTVDATALPLGVPASSLTVVRDGQPAADCTGPAGTAVPDPCVQQRRLLPSGDLEITVLSVHASTWNVAQKVSAPPSSSTTTDPTGGSGGTTGGTGSTAGSGSGPAPTPPAGPVGVSINDGAQFANDPLVHVSVVWPLGAATLSIANDGGFRGATTQTVEPLVDWTLASSGPERLPKTIYVRFGQSTQTFQDDIILDETPPVVDAATYTAGSGASAAVARRRVTLKARDKTSGVRFAEYAVRASRPSAAMRYAARLSVPVTAKMVRVRDGAGNWSAWRRIKPKKKR